MFRIKIISIILLCCSVLPAYAEICKGASYWDASLSVCSPCPYNYTYNTADGKVDISECQVKCKAGDYVSEPRLVSDGKAYIDTGIVSTGKTYVEIIFQFTTTPVMDSVSKVYAVWGAIPYNYQNNTGSVIPRISLGVQLGKFFTGINNTHHFANFDTDIHTFKLNARDGIAFFDDKTFKVSTAPNMEMPFSSYLFARQTLSGPDTVTKGLIIYRYREFDEYGGDLLRDMVPTVDSDGVVCMYDSVSDKCFYSMGEGGFGEAFGCFPVGEGYWAAESVVNFGAVGIRNKCPEGLTTIGYGAGADESSDCGRILHVGDKKIYLRSEKKTVPSLNVRIGDKVFYGNMSVEGFGPMKINVLDVEYGVYDDSMSD